MEIRLQYRLLSTIFLIYVASIANARTMTIDECVAKAEEHYPEVAQYGLIDATMSFNVSNAAKAWLPQVGIYGQGTWQNDVMEFPQALTDMLAKQGVSYPGINKLQYKAGVNIEQSVWDGGAADAKKEQIRAKAEIQKKSVALNVYDVATRVEEVYFSILIIDRQIQQMRVTKKLLDTVMNTVNVRISNGIAMESDRYETEAKIVETNRQIDRMSIMQTTYRSVLGFFVGENMENVTLIAPTVTENQTTIKPTDEIYQAKLAHLSATEKAISVSLRPKIGAFANAYYGYPGFNTFKSMTSPNPSFNFLAGIKLNWNIGEFYTRRNRIDILTTQRRTIETEHKTLEYNRNIQSMKINGEIAALESALTTDKRMMELRQQIRMTAQTQYANGMTDATTLLSKVTDEEASRIAMTIDDLMITQTLYKLNRNNNR